MKSLTRRLGLAAAVGLLLAPTSSVLAQTVVGPIEVRRNAVRVLYADLDTNTMAGMGLLDARIDSAVVTVCRFHRGRLTDAVREPDCRQGARTDAWDQFARNERVSYAQADRVIELATVATGSN